MIITNPPLVPFDQPTISVEAAETLFPADRYPNTLNPGFPETAFRSNAFPTAETFHKDSAVGRGC